MKLPAHSRKSVTKQSKILFMHEGREFFRVLIYAEKNFRNNRQAVCKKEM